MQRRELLRRGAISAVALAGVGPAWSRARRARKVKASRLPRWRGFNLLEKFTLAHSARYRESDFDWIHGWGFAFVRLPMDYPCWTAAARTSPTSHSTAISSIGRCWICCARASPAQ